MAATTAVEVRVSPAQLQLLQLLVKVGATNAGNAMTAADLAAKSKGAVTEAWIKDKGYYKGNLAKNGFTGVAKTDGAALGYYATAKGVKASKETAAPAKTAPAKKTAAPAKKTAPKMPKCAAK